jgi:integrative and conjugative element protein (TIGR02256 family)
MWIHPFQTSARILIEPNVIDTISQFRQDAALKPEAGGILLGYRRGQHLHIVEATIPQHSDRRSLFGFLRRDRYHRDIAIKRWRESNATIDYLGEWHSHPEVCPTPSSIDVSEWRKICRREPVDMVFMIVGMGGFFWLGVGTDDHVFKASVAL